MTEIVLLLSPLCLNLSSLSSIHALLHIYCFVHIMSALNNDEVFIFLLIGLFTN